MPEHYTKNTLECTAWCPKCRRQTQHRVDHPVAGGKGGGRRGPCIDPDHPVQELTQEQAARREKKDREALQPNLFAEPQR